MLTAGESCSWLGFAKTNEMVYGLFASIVFESLMVMINVPELFVHTAVDSTLVAKLPESGNDLVSEVSLPVNPVMVIEDTIPPAEPTATLDWSDTVILFSCSPG